MELANSALPMGTGPYTVPVPCWHPSPTRGHQSTGTCVWQVPACHTWVSAASLLLPRSTSWFYGSAVCL